MSKRLSKVQSPEERELNKKRAELGHLESKLAEYELGLMTLKTELCQFEEAYLRIVGVRYAQIDELEALIAEALAGRSPMDGRAQASAAEARSRARESAHAAEGFSVSPRRQEFRPSENLKSLYRELAKRIHPDLALDEEERTRRNSWMADANNAYQEGDEAKLRAILDEWEYSPDSISGDGTGAELIRIIRKIAQVEDRLRSIELEITELKRRDLYRLKNKARQAASEGHDLLAEMASHLDTQIAECRRHLNEMTIHAGKK